MFAIVEGPKPAGISFINFWVKCLAKVCIWTNFLVWISSKSNYLTILSTLSSWYSFNTNLPFNPDNAMQSYASLKPPFANFSLLTANRTSRGSSHFLFSIENSSNCNVTRSLLGFGGMNLHMFIMALRQAFVICMKTWTKMETLSLRESTACKDKPDSNTGLDSQSLSTLTISLLCSSTNLTWRTFQSFI